MKKIYRIKPISERPKDPTGEDRKKREKIEETLGHKFTESEWFNYKLMIKGLKR